MISLVKKLRVDGRYHFLYSTINKTNGKYYLGIHSSNRVDDNYLGSGYKLKLAIKKYGKENFKRQILFYADSREEILLLEQSMVTDKLLSDPLTYNVQKGGQGVRKTNLETGKIFTESGLASLREKRMGQNNAMFGKIGDKNPQWKQYYHTPWGVFGSWSETINSTPLSEGQVRRYCKKLTDSYLIPKTVKFLRSLGLDADTSKTYRDLGFFISKEK